MAVPEHCEELRSGHGTLTPASPGDLGHTPDGLSYQGPEHRRCNRKAGGTNGAAATNAREKLGWLQGFPARSNSQEW